ncbi:uncharacterized protein LOC113315026 [Papaver somniferum]|uniref:uncharacterized protein LOC113315026 n=1 Tax=Papaver somniferum TaxID=3469 RepID=UPI000E705E16|nr:uncharacterized protein LOC113315026 [Papaver somniferum]XP_026419121.1 uncharacterized protein LOC113315026 [Papaver somniferum]
MKLRPKVVTLVMVRRRVPNKLGFLPSIWMKRMRILGRLLCKCREAGFLRVKGVHLMAVVPKWFLHSSKRNLQRLELGLINQFMTVMSWMAFAKKTVDSFVLAMRFGQTVQQVMTLTNLLSVNCLWTDVWLTTRSRSSPSHARGWWSLICIA